MGQAIFLEVAMYAAGGRRGLIVILKGRGAQPFNSQESNEATGGYGGYMEQPTTLDQSFGARGSALYPFQVAEEDEVCKEAESKAIVANCGLLWEWRGQLEKIK